MKRIFAILLLLMCCHVYAQDSLKPVHEAKQVLDGADSIQNAANSPKPFDKVDSIRATLALKIDSLTTLLNLNHVVIVSLDSLKGKLDSLKNFDLLKDAGAAVEKVRQAEQKLEETISSIEGSINEKLGLFSNNGGNIPGDVQIPSDAFPDVSNPLSNVNEQLQLRYPEVADMEPTALPEPELMSDAKEKFGAITTNETITEARNVTEEFSNLTQELNGYTADVKNLTEGNVEQVLEEKAASLDEVKALKEEIEPATDYTELIKKWNSDPQVVREMALNKAKEQAINHFAGHESELRSAMEQLSKMKARVPDKEKIVDLFDKRPQSLRHQTFRERLVPGLTFQTQKQSSFWLDINPQVGCKLNGRWFAGLGWNERLAYDFHNSKWDKGNRLYGLRSFIHFQLKEALWLKGDVEVMNPPVRATRKLSSEITGRGWIWGYFAGVKKDFRFSKHVEGNVQLLYNLYDPRDASPYTNRLNVRMGFEFPVKKSPKGKKPPRHASS